MRPKKGDVLLAKISLPRRAGLQRAHTATHLLHLALRQLLGEHARQTGSLVEDDILRFDFSHPVALTTTQIAEVTQLVYQNILADEPVTVLEMAQQQARDAGYTALFGEKYGDWVRTVNIGDAVAGSHELCGGTHVTRSGEIGLFTIISEGSVSAGNRRIEAITGMKAADRARQQNALLLDISQELKVLPDELPGRLQIMQQELRTLHTQLNDYKVKIAALGSGSEEISAEKVAGIQLIIRQLSGVDAETLAGLCDQYLARITPGIVVLASAVAGKVLLAVKVSKELTGKYHAGNIVRVMAKITGGGGGGRADFAQAGGKDAAMISAAFDEVRALLKEIAANG